MSRRCATSVPWRRPQASPAVEARPPYRPLSAAGFRPSRASPDRSRGFRRSWRQEQKLPAHRAGKGKPVARLPSSSSPPRLRLPRPERGTADSTVRREQNDAVRVPGPAAAGGSLLPMFAAGRRRCRAASACHRRRTDRAAVGRPEGIGRAFGSGQRLRGRGRQGPQPEREARRRMRRRRSGGRRGRGRRKWDRSWWRRDLDGVSQVTSARQYRFGAIHPNAAATAAASTRNRDGGHPRRSLPGARPGHHRRRFPRARRPRPRSLDSRVGGARRGVASRSFSRQRRSNRRKAAVGRRLPAASSQFTSVL